MSIGFSEGIVILLVLALLFGPKLGRVGLELGRIVGGLRASKRGEGLSARPGNEVARTVVETAELVQKVRQATKFTRFPFRF